MSDPPDFESEPQHASLSADDAPEDFEPSATELDDALRRRAPPRIRIAQVVTLLIVLATLGGLLLHSGALTFNRPQPTTAVEVTATPALNIDGPIVLLSNVSNGTVTLNGAPLSGSTPLVTTFKRGLNTVTMTVPPFQSRTCHIQWPSRQNDGGCDFPPTSSLQQSFAGQILSPALIVVLSFDMQALPASDQTQALAAADSTFASIAPHMGVPVGEYIATGQDANGAIFSHRTETPVQATLLATTTTFDYYGDTFLENTSASPGSVAWRVAVEVHLNWQFSPSSSDSADSPPWSIQLPETVVVTYDKQLGWGIDQSATQQLAGYGLSDGILQDMCNAGFDALNTTAQQQSDYVASRNNHLQGCEFDLMTLQNTPAGRFIYRFGVLLAADAQAHALLPSIPFAPATALAAFGT